MPKRQIGIISSTTKNSGRWWDLIKSNKKKKWDKLIHNGPLFPPAYEPLPTNVKIKHKGVQMELDNTNTNNIFNVTAEEAALFYAQALETNDRTIKEGKKLASEDIRKDKTFNTNFLRDWNKILKKSRITVKKLSDIDFSPMITFIEQRREQKKEEKAAMTKQDKELEKLRKEEIKKVYGYALFDDVMLPITNNIEPPSLFKGHGASKERGRIKARITPKDVTLNISRGDTPECFSNGNKCKWAGVVHDKNAAWLSRWKNPITLKTVYTKINRNFDPWVGQNDYRKFEKARKLDKKINTIRKKYKKDFKIAKKQELAAAVYLLDAIAIRPGTEQGEEGTRGLTTLKCENIKWLPGNKITISFVGKSSIEYDKTVEIHPDVYKILKTGCVNPSDQVFPNITARTLNEYLGSLSKGLTAKVFRTWKASSEVSKALNKVKIKKNADLSDKKSAFVKANLMAALALNHKRMTDNSSKIKKIKDKIKVLKKQLRACKTQTQIKNKKARIVTEKLKLSEAENNVNIGTSKANYIDPRVIVSWAKKNDVPIEAIYKTVNDRKKFIWAMETPSTWSF